ncbi:DUF6624 domain-containing protein [Deinococcus pimensis]|uniref:DUF6624 domain-containing protein n=1 Tax=Deinococcus pimensis TaxID=309888 RepID=UPI0004B41B4F|nr:DUF6624 domain-containing protein [Deinococcus pimensis]
MRPTTLLAPLVLLAVTTARAQQPPSKLTMPAPAACRALLPGGVPAAPLSDAQRVTLTSTLAALRARRDEFSRAFERGDLTVRDRYEQYQDDVAKALRDLVRTVGWPDENLAGPELNTLAWDLANTARDRDLQDCVLALARPTLKTPEDARRYALLADFTAFGRTGAQEYGSIFSTSGLRLRPAPLRDPEHVDARRATLGLPPLAQYLAQHQAQLPLPAGLTRTVTTPAACREFTSDAALNVWLDRATLVRMEDHVEALVRQDQASRKGELGAKDILVVDTESTAYLKTILRLFGWPSTNRAGAYLAQNAWLLAQHADATPALQLCVLKLIERQASTPAERTNLAYLTDRVLLARGEPQVYGTQVTVDDVAGKATPRMLRDPANVDARRRAVGLEPLADYLRRFEPGQR